ncbi:MAG: leucine-rich repeat domain-containing protein [Eubacteriales bacterium]|nr:leucine-rich repeat domain-containing protein [Eubacteriales bacterium]
MYDMRKKILSLVLILTLALQPVYVFADEVSERQEELASGEILFDEECLDFKENQEENVEKIETVEMQAEEAEGYTEELELEDTPLTAGSGTCGENLTWTLDKNGKLTITGSGKMDWYYGTTTAPWGRDITEVYISNGVSEVGAYAFSSCEKLIKVSLPNSVTEIGDGAFEYCSSLKEIVIADCKMKLHT